SQLDHPNILPFLGIYHQTTNSPPMTILPFMEHGSLQDLLTGMPIAPGTFPRMLIGIASGVAYLHSRYPAIIHDMLQGNVLLDSGGTPCLCDFGLSRIRHEVTRSRTILQEGGRLRFLAPELSKGWTKRFRTSSASDVFSLAMMFYNIWTGKIPFFEFQSDIKAAAKFRKGERPTEPTASMNLPPELKEQLWELLHEMWAQKPASRPSSTNIVNCLMRIFTASSDPIPSTQHPSQVQPQLGHQVGQVLQPLPGYSKTSNLLIKPSVYHHKLNHIIHPLPQE
ncbi:kinase-like protein, partial [Clavulina sp. PMI_390]